jgi:hypothetical protein
VVVLVGTVQEHSYFVTAKMGRPAAVAAFVLHLD